MPLFAGILGRVLLSFSVYSNSSKILNTNQPSGTLTAVNGIRFISMTWVILGHSFQSSQVSAGTESIYLCLFSGNIENRT